MPDPTSTSWQPGDPLFSEPEPLDITRVLIEPLSPVESMSSLSFSDYDDVRFCPTCEVLWVAPHPTRSPKNAHLTHCWVCSRYTRPNLTPWSWADFIQKVLD